MVRDRELTEGDLEEAKELALSHATALLQARIERYEDLIDTVDRMRCYAETRPLAESLDQSDRLVDHRKQHINTEQLRGPV